MTKEELLCYIEEQYGALPEYLWKKFPNYGVFRQSENRKWFAVWMEIPKTKLGVDSDTVVPTLTVKCDPILIGSLCQKEGYFPAYHMNKNHWITLLLDGSVPQEEIFLLLQNSYVLTKKKERVS